LILRSRRVFEKWGRGKTWTPDEPWMFGVIRDAIWWKEYGCPIDPYVSLTNQEYMAHLAILEGRALEIEAQNRKNKQK